MRTIEVDLDIHKLIETGRRNFSEAPNTVLRRLLDLRGPEQRTNGLSVEEPGSGQGAWTGKGVTLPEGTKLRMEYRGKQHFGVIENAFWVIDGEKYKSPSAAAGGTARTKVGRKPSLDGWKYWWVQLPGENVWRDLNELRKSV